MKNLCFALLSCTLLAGFAGSGGTPTFGVGQPPSPVARFDVNDSAVEANGFPVINGVPGPYFAEVAVGEPFRMQFKGQPFKAMLVAVGDLAPGAQPLPIFGSLDMVNQQILYSPLKPFATALDNLFFTNIIGEVEVSFTVPQILAGTQFTYQAIILNNQAALLTNAVEVTFVP